MEFPPATFDKKTKIWTTPKVPLVYNTECALGRIIYSHLNSYPNTTLQIDHSANVTLKSIDVLTMAKRIAQHFDKMELKQDDIIGFAVKNTTHVLPTVIACFFNCTPLHPVNPILDQSTVAHCFAITKPKVIFCDSEVYEKVYLATKAFKPRIFTMSGEIEGITKVTDLLQPTNTEMFYNPKHYGIGGHQVAAILCSSGTTGKPKAVCLSGSGLVYEAPFLNSETIMYIPSTIDWITGLSNIVVSCLTGATRVIADKPFSADLFIELMKKYRITNTFLAPRYIAVLVKHPQATKELFSSLMMVQCGGSTISEIVFRSFRSLLDDYAVIIYAYGSTEANVSSLNILTSASDSHFTSVGKLMPNMKLRIVDDAGNNVGYNKAGEIFIDHGKYWPGYYGNPVETQRMRDAQGWFHTGDLGYMDDDNNLYVVDRKKEIRKYLGLHFWPKEIEETIIEMPGIKDACVVTVPDETKGDCSGALVVKAKDCLATEQDIVEYVKKRLVDIHKQIHAGVIFVDYIPQNSNGKMVRVESKKIFEVELQRNLQSEVCGFVILSDNLYWSGKRNKQMASVISGFVPMRITLGGL